MKLARHFELTPDQAAVAIGALRTVLEAGGPIDPREEELLSACAEALELGDGALRAVGGAMKLTIPADVAIDAEVDLGPTPGAYGIAVRMTVHLPGMPREQAQALVDAAHRVCPYSNATRGNITVDLTLA